MQSSKLRTRKHVLWFGNAVASYAESLPSSPTLKVENYISGFEKLFDAIKNYRSYQENLTTEAKYSNYNHLSLMPSLSRLGKLGRFAVTLHFRTSQPTWSKSYLESV